MKKVIILTLLAAICLPVAAQEKGHRKLTREEFRTQQIAFITETAELTAEEAGLFFPLYFELQDKKAELNCTHWKQMRGKASQDLSEEACDKLLNDFYDSRIEACKLDKAYHAKFKKILSAKKIIKVQKADMRFKRQMFRGKHH